MVYSLNTIVKVSQKLEPKDLERFYIQYSSSWYDFKTPPGAKDQAIEKNYIFEVLGAYMDRNSLNRKFFLRAIAYMKCIKGLRI